MVGVSHTSPNDAKIEAYIAPQGDVDWFRFQLTQVADINVQLTSLPADYDLYLYDAGGSLLGASEQRGLREERIAAKDQPAGFYYVQIAGFAGAWQGTKPYQLRFKTNP